MSASHLKFIFLLILIAMTCGSLSWRRRNNRNFKMYGIMNIRRANGKEYNNTKSKHNFHDMPKRADLDVYLNSLQRIVDFSSMNKNDIDINYVFGLFLINVNLKIVIQRRPTNIPLRKLQPIRDMVHKNTALLTFFRHMVEKDSHPGYTQSKAIYSLFSDDTIWVERVERYDAVYKADRSRRTYRQLEAMYQTWEQYMKQIYDWEKRAVPGPKQSDHCVSALGEVPVKAKGAEAICVLPKECYAIIENGSNSGYALTHRLLLMILARYGRGCSIFSTNKDRQMTTKFCTDAYAEAQYIAMHFFGVMDLLMEQIAFCSLDGHIEFLERAWLSSALHHQTSSGCYSPEKERRKTPTHRIMSPTYRNLLPAQPWLLAKNPNEQTINGGECNGHLTATAAAAFSSAVRFIALTTKFP